MTWAAYAAVAACTKRAPYMWSWWSVYLPVSWYRPGVGSCMRIVVGLYSASSPAIDWTTWSLVYVDCCLTGVAVVNWAPSAGILPFHSPRRLSGFSAVGLRASRICSQTRLTCGRAMSTSSSAWPPPAVGMTVRFQALVRSPVTIWAYAQRMPFCRASA